MEYVEFMEQLSVLRKYRDAEFIYNPITSGLMYSFVRADSSMAFIQSDIHSEDSGVYVTTDGGKCLYARFYEIYGFTATDSYVSVYIFGKTYKARLR